MMQLKTERTLKMEAGMKRVVMTAVMMTGIVMPMLAQQQQPVKDDAAVTLKGAPDGASHSWTNDQLLTSSVHEAWVLSGRNEDQFFEMVKELAAISAQKRGLTLPETEAAGKKAGEMIKKEARKDPDQLLYAVVDHAVLKTGTKTGATTAPAN